GLTWPGVGLRAAGATAPPPSLALGGDAADARVADRGNRLRRPESGHGPDPSVHVRSRLDPPRGGRHRKAVLRWALWIMPALRPPDSGGGCDGMRVPLRAAPGGDVPGTRPVERARGAPTEPRGADREGGAADALVRRA